MTRTALFQLSLWGVGFYSICSVAVIRTPGPEAVRRGEDLFHLMLSGHGPSLREVRKKHNQALKQKPWGKAGSSSVFLTSLSHTLEISPSRNGTAYSAVDPLTSINSRCFFTEKKPQAMTEAILQLSLLSPS